MAAHQFEVTMAFKSLAQARRAKKLLEDGEISKKEYNRMADGTPSDLPERAEPKPRKADPNKWPKWPRK
jgi:hypothetical protein